MVRIWCFCINAIVLFDIRKSICREPSFTAIINFIAVDELLFAQWYQFVIFFEVLTFETASGTKGPTGATLLLIFDRSYVTLEVKTGLSFFVLKGSVFWYHYTNKNPSFDIIDMNCMFSHIHSLDKRVKSHPIALRETNF